MPWAVNNILWPFRNLLVDLLFVCVALLLLLGSGCLLATRVDVFSKERPGVVLQHKDSDKAARRQTQHLGKMKLELSK